MSLNKETKPTFLAFYSLFFLHHLSFTFHSPIFLLFRPFPIVPSNFLFFPFFSIIIIISFFLSFFLFVFPFTHSFTFVSFPFFIFYFLLSPDLTSIYLISSHLISLSLSLFLFLSSCFSFTPIFFLSTVYPSFSLRHFISLSFPSLFH